MRKKAILLIDDDTLFLMLTRKLLNDQPYLERIDTATSVEEVQHYFKSLKENSTPLPDAIFIDLDMPLVNGLELAQQLKADYLNSPSDTKIYILSSSISQRDRQTAESLDAVTDYMEKPLSPEVLKQALGLENIAPSDRERHPGNREHQEGEKSNL